VLRRSGRLIPFLVLSLVFAGACADDTPVRQGPAASSLPAAVDASIRSGLKNLHDGLYAQAEDSFREAARAVPDDPAPPLFLAFSFWWRMIQDRSDRTLDEVFLAAAERTVATGERRLEAAPGDVRILTCIGTVHVLRSQVEAIRRNIFKAAQEARRGRRSLDAVLQIDPSNRDALFGMGAYNYYTEKLPGFARSLLFMSKGDAALGLEQLRTLAASDAYFSTDARLLLALICGSRDERCYNDALGQLQAALAANPGSPLLLGSMAEIRMRLGYYAEAVRAFEEALASATGESAERVRQRRLLKLYLAEALAADWRLARASELLQAVGDSATLPVRDRQLVERLATEIAQKGGALVTAGSAPVTGDHPIDTAGANTPPAVRLSDRVHEALAALNRGSDSEALALLAATAEAYPGDPLPRFLIGRVNFDRGRFSEAERMFAEARARSTGPPPWMDGWIELYRGMIQRTLGRRDAARAHFQAASEVRHFRSAERGILELQEGVPPHSRCRP
jgi:tetratricopeptide (TPR) repeat protein